MQLSERARAALQKPINELEFSVRTDNGLKMALGDDALIHQLVFKSEEDLLCIPNFGRVSLREVKQVLATFDLCLGMTEGELLPAPVTKQVNKNMLPISDVPSKEALTDWLVGALVGDNQALQIQVSGAILEFTATEALRRAIAVAVHRGETVQHILAHTVTVTIEIDVQNHTGNISFAPL